MNGVTEGEDYRPTPRAYQRAILNKAQYENSIVFLPPGTGKTFVTAMLIKLMYGNTLGRYSEAGKRTFFLLDSQVLAEKRKEYIRNFTSLSVGPSVEEEACLKVLEASTWKGIWDKYQVLVIKSKRFMECLKNNYISMKNVNLLIFDECHNASRKVNVMKILKTYQFSRSDERPRILGLTATLVDKEVAIDKFPRAIAKLEKRMQCTLTTIGCISEIERFITSPIEKQVPYDEPVELKFLDKIKARIKYISEFVMGYNRNESVNNLPFSDETILYEDIELSRKLVRNLVDVWYNIEKMGIYGGSISALKLMMYVQRLGAKTTSRNSTMVYLAFIKILVMLREALDKKMEGACEIAKIYEYSSYQVTTLLDVLKEFRLGNNRCIIFVERKSTAEVLFNILKTSSDNIESMNFIRADFIVGVGKKTVSCNHRQYVNEGNLELFERFKTGKINVLVTTDIQSEGFDIPECKLVIRFDIPKTYRTYVLSKGWATVKNSYHVILTPRKEKREVWETMIEYRSKEDLLYQILAGQSGCMAQLPDVRTQKERKGNIHEDDTESASSQNMK